MMHYFAQQSCNGLSAIRYFVHVHSYNDSVTQLEMCSLLRSLSIRKLSKKPIPKIYRKIDTENVENQFKCCKTFFHFFPVSHYLGTSTGKASTTILKFLGRHG